MQVYAIPEPDGSRTVLVHAPGLLRKHLQPLYDELLQLPTSEWTQGSFLGRPIPRLARWHQQSGLQYKFSGKIMESRPYTKYLKALQSKLPHLLRESGLPMSVGGVRLDFDSLNSVLINKYRDNTDSISAHADDEDEFGRDPTIVSINLGAPRKFVMRRMTKKKYDARCKTKGKKRPDLCTESPPAVLPNPRKYEFTLDHGDVMIMAGAAQRYWTHEVPKEPERAHVERYQLAEGPKGKRKRLLKLTPTSTRFNLTFRPYQK